ncbi:ribosome-inactivating family protein, partial [Kitasatospora sp. NPDC058201]|uniref:ribosome-inactivating family protein n=1 Tax=unclassified Kitasatospora TaxID=2633591 RepID=UPI0036549709
MLTLLAAITTLLGGSIASSPPAVAATDHSVDWRYYRTDNPSVRASHYQTMIASLRATGRSYRDSMYRTGTGNTEIVVFLGDHERMSLYFNAENMYLIGFRSWAHNARAYSFTGEAERVREFTNAGAPHELPMASDYPALERVAGAGRSVLRYSSESILNALSTMRAYDGDQARVSNADLAGAVLRVAAITAEASRFHHIADFMHAQAGSISAGVMLPAEYLMEENSWGRLSEYTAHISQDPTHPAQVIGQRHYRSFLDVVPVLALVLSAAIDRTCKRSVPSPTWSPWVPFGGGLAGDPTAVSQAPNSLDVFAQGNDGHLYQRSYNGAVWQDFADLGATPSGGFVGTPAVVSPENGRLDVFVRGTTDELWHKSYVNDTWSAWESLGGDLRDSPTAISRGPGSLDVFISGADNDLEVRSWTHDGSWTTNWTELDGRIVGAPTVVSPENGRLDVFVRGTTDELWHKSYVNDTWS